MHNRLIMHGDECFGLSSQVLVYESDLMLHIMKPLNSVDELRMDSLDVMLQNQCIRQ